MATRRPAVPRRRPDAARAGPPGVERALYVAHEDVWHPSDLTRGPWDPAAQHGGAPAALLARAIERCEPDGAMVTARIAFDFLRPVPLEPLEVVAGVVRPGTRVMLIEATVTAGGRAVCRARALRIRGAEDGLEEVGRDTAPPPPESGRPVRFPRTADGPTFASDGVEMSFVAGDYGPGPATVWIRLRHPVVGGEDPSPLERTVAAADFGNGVSAVLDWTAHVFINPDLTVYLDRPPEGEWICLEAVTRVGSAGVGLAESALHDRRGPFGRAAQALYVARR